MRTVLLASLRTHTRRYGAALLAVVVGVVFILVTAALSSAVRNGLTAGLAEPYDGADAVVEKPTTEQAARLLAAAPDAGADAWLVGWTIQPLTHDDTVVDASADVGQVADRPDRRWQEVEHGRLPTVPGEAVADVNAAKGAGIRIGDTVTVGAGEEARQLEVVGLVDSPSPFASASLYLLWEDLAHWVDSVYVSSVAWSGPGGHDAAADAVRAVVPDARVMTLDAFVAQVHEEVNNGVDLIAIVVLLFAAIALLVAVLVINNTFAILFAQRTRDFALLRCVGATRGQVLRSVRLESLALGSLAAILGLGLGLGAGHGLVALVRAQWPGADLGTAEVGPAWVLAAVGVAVGVTLVAAWLPTRRVVGVSPLAALRPDDATSVRTRPGRLRAGAGLLTLAAGATLMAIAVAGSILPALVAGGTLAFAGILLLGPVLVPSVIRALTPVAGRALGATGRLAGDNAVRNPRRTAATTASLLIGVTLTTAVLTGMASSRAALAKEMARQHPVDVAVTATDALPAELHDRIAAVDGVRAVLSVPGTAARLEGVGELPVLAAPTVRDAGVRAVVHGDQLPAPGPGQVVLPWDELGDGVAVGDEVAVAVGGRSMTLRVRGGEGWGGAALVHRRTLARLDPAARPRAAWVRATAEADAEDLAGSLQAIATPAGAELENGLAKRDYVDLQLDVLTGGVVGLLGIAVLIALVGIANTLGLSVLERGREHALLRALGLTRRQLRRMLAAEAVLLSLVATILGTAVGVVFAWAGVQAMVQPVVADARLVLPVDQLAFVLGVSAVAGLVAAVLPSRRAARTTPAAGLALD
ncbi:ABC transporter permease [Nocardioides sp. SYSU DS0651]|uniref:ABC transporter permease n=1 Tax=Nocardioides sp. SYSU DS0651 TaxID=3415955 RepID=UPI003F4B9155